MKFTSVYLLVRNLIIIIFASSAFAGTVTVANPANGSATISPVDVHATYSGSVPATYMKIWVDHVAGTSQHSTNVFDATIALANGPHLIEVQAQDAGTGIVSTTASKITVSNGAVSISPASTSVQPGGTQQFTAVDNAGLAVTWSATGGTITTTGFYTAGASAGNFSVTATDSKGNAATAAVTIAGANTVAIQSPGKGTTVKSPLHVLASYSGSVPATYMKIWLDGTASTVQHNTNVFDTVVGLTKGLHEISIEAKDAITGMVHKAKVMVTVGGASQSYTTWKNDNARTGQQSNETHADAIHCKFFAIRIHIQRSRGWLRLCATALHARLVDRGGHAQCCICRN